VLAERGLLQAVASFHLTAFSSDAATDTPPKKV